MLQIDPFWAYSFGAGFALAAGQELRRRAAARAPEPVKPSEVSEPATPTGLLARLADPYLALTTLFTAVVFVPTGTYLLWAHPEWETMHVGTPPDWLAAAVPLANVLLAVGGYLVTGRLVARGADRAAYLQFVGGYFGFFFVMLYGWDGTGYQRFLSPDTASFAAWGDASLTEHLREFAGSSTATAINVVVGVTVVLLVASYVWVFASASRMPLPRAAARVSAALLGGAGIGLVSALAATVAGRELGWPGLAACALVALLFLLPRRGLAARAVATLTTG